MDFISEVKVEFSRNENQEITNKISYDINYPSRLSAQSYNHSKKAYLVNKTIG